ncbi:hypothetical protein EVAR_80095_1 [Eumeta japonica]|uniref:Uncharacterized protein n=1 Tax=Eumeta variegata TaxID=151549 RepID=A0A4C1UE34_EUMVA|nr:hypothetical protein EVAR_80095_1 [Eumeta japonica]
MELSAPSSDADYHTVSKYSSRRIKRAQTDGAASFNYGVPMATFWLHHQTLITITSRESNEPKLMVALFNYGVPMTTFQLHHQIDYQSIKVPSRRIKRAQTRWCRRLRSSHGHLLAPSSDANYHIVSKYSSRGIKRAQTRWGCVV